MSLDGAPIREHFCELGNRDLRGASLLAVALVCAFAGCGAQAPVSRFNPGRAYRKPP
jgi:hypothetical protein